jgi:hypothetical protein
MKVKVITRAEEALEDCDYRDAMEVHIDGKRVISAYDGEPEDNSLGRNFNDFFGIGTLLKQAFEAGKNGEEFELEHIDSMDI